MAEAIVTILGQEVHVPCAPRYVDHMRDLAADLERRLQGAEAGGDAEAASRLARVALQLMAENQAAGASLARANAEIDQLNDLLLARPGLETAAERS